MARMPGQSDGLLDFQHGSEVLMLVSLLEILFVVLVEDFLALQVPVGVESELSLPLVGVDVGFLLHLLVDDVVLSHLLQVLNLHFFLLRLDGLEQVSETVFFLGLSPGVEGGFEYMGFPGDGKLHFLELPKPDFRLVFLDLLQVVSDFGLEHHLGNFFLYFVLVDCAVHLLLVFIQSLLLRIAFVLEEIRLRKARKE